MRADTEYMVFGEGRGETTVYPNYIKGHVVWMGFSLAEAKRNLATAGTGYVIYSRRSTAYSLPGGTMWTISK